MKPHTANGSSLRGDCSYYDALGVAFDATDEDIRKNYHNIVRTLHPDRRRPGSTGGEALEHFHQVQSAWRCLSDPTRRLIYDLRTMGHSSLTDDNTDTDPDGPSVEEKLRSLQKEQAARDVQNMNVALEKVLQRERATRGVLIRNAIFGDLRLRDDCLANGIAGKRTIEQKDLVGPFIDVTLPLQCLVEQHAIVLPGGACASKADLPGFYNPLPMEFDAELSLYVLYDFRGNLHEIIVGDRETLSLPLKSHAVPQGKIPRGPFSPANVARKLCQTKPPVAVDSARSATSQHKAGVGHKDSMKTSQPDSVKADVVDALHQAVIAYRYQGVLCRGPGDATPREFFIVVGTGVALSLMALWAVSCGGKRS